MGESPMHTAPCRVAAVPRTTPQSAHSTHPAPLLRGDRRLMRDGEEDGGPRLFSLDFCAPLSPLTALAAVLAAQVWL